MARPAGRCTPRRPSRWRPVDQPARVHDLQVPPGDDIELVPEVAVETGALIPLTYQGEPLWARIMRQRWSATAITRASGDRPDVSYGPCAGCAFVRRSPSGPRCRTTCGRIGFLARGIGRCPVVLVGAGQTVASGVGGGCRRRPDHHCRRHDHRNQDGHDDRSTTGARGRRQGRSVGLADGRRERPDVPWAGRPWSGSTAHRGLRDAPSPAGPGLPTFA